MPRKLRMEYPGGGIPLLAAAAERVGASHYGSDRRESGEEKAGRIIREDLRRGGRREEDLPGMRKGDKVKVLLARRLRRETAMSLKWIARRLHMGSWTYVSNLLNEKRKKTICGNSED